MRFVLCFGIFAAALTAQPKRVLYVTHSAGFRHGSIPASARAMQDIAVRSNGRLSVEWTEDVAPLNAETLAGFDAVFFFTSGELPMNEAQKSALVEFVRGGKGFGGAHSATDTFYQWAEYGELIGARFNGHPWVQSARVEIEDPAHPASMPVAPSFEMVEEYYQFRGFSRARSRVLMTIDVRTIDLSKPDANPNTVDFPVAWVHPYGRGRVFYTSLGHFDETWRDPRFQATLERALLWLTGQEPGIATPGGEANPQFTAAGIANAASLSPAGTVANETLISIFGRGLSGGATAAADLRAPVYKLAGTTVRIGGEPVPLHFASPGQINALVPRAASSVEVQVADAKLAVNVTVAPAAPGIFAVTTGDGYAVAWMTGLGTGAVTATVDGAVARVLYAGPAPGWPGLQQVNVETRARTGTLVVETAGVRTSARF
ncbi:MAG: ThuA domain-containing protein [Bryobacteraceae bacterium]|nr:ThuA domain-containing protein [Bryobacteraceae bacterium]